MKVLKIYEYDCSSFELLDVKVIKCNNEEECELEIIKHHYDIEWCNWNTELNLEQYIEKYKVSDLVFYENYGYEIV